MSKAASRHGQGYQEGMALGLLEGTEKPRLLAAAFRQGAEAGKESRA